MRLAARSEGGSAVVIALPLFSEATLTLHGGAIMADLSSDIELAAQGPKSHSVDGETAVARDIDDLIKADKYLAAKTAAANGRGGLRFSKFVPGGAAGTPVQGGGQ